MLQEAATPGSMSLTTRVLEPHPVGDSQGMMPWIHGLLLVLHPAMARLPLLRQGRRRRGGHQFLPVQQMNFQPISEGGQARGFHLTKSVECHEAFYLVKPVELTHLAAPVGVRFL